nr:putative ribonuclease H-like domain-containing protein [Tanacetum cinerariifolium]
MTSYLNAVKKIFKYIKGQPTLGLWYLRDYPFQLEAYSDSDYDGSHGDRKSTTGGCQFLGRRLISWQCKKQTVVATSSTEAEYVAPASTRIGGKNKPKGRLTIVYSVYSNFCAGMPPILLVVLVFLLVVLVPADGWVPTGSSTIPTGSCTLPTGSYSFMLLGWFLLFWATAIVHNHEAGPSEIIATIDGNETIDPSPRPTFDFIAKLFSNMKLNWDGPHMPFLAPMLVVPAGGDDADAAAAYDVPPPPPPPIVPPTHSSSSTPGPSTAAQALPVRETTPVRQPTPSPVREPTPFWEPTPDYPRPPSPPPYPRSEESNEAPQTPAATAAGGAKDSAALTDLSLKLDRCINRVTTLENKLGVTKKVLGSVVLKLVSRVKRLEGLLHQRKRRLVLINSEGEEVASTDQDIDLDALHKLASTSLGGDSTVEAAYTIYKASQDAHASSDAGHDAAKVPDVTTMPFKRTCTTRKRLRKPFTSLASDHFSENIFAVKDTLPADEGNHAAAPTIPTGSTTILAGSSMDPAVQATTADPSSTIPAADKGKAPMAKKLHAEQEEEFARQQKEVAYKAQAESVASPAEQGTGLSDQCRRELDAAQLIYTEADWLDLMAKIATNSALSKQLLGDDVDEDNMNERLGMLLMRKRRELDEQSRVKALSLSQLKHEFEYIQRTLERSNLLNFKKTTFRPTPSLEAPSAKTARQEVPQDVHTASLQVLAGVFAAPSTTVAISVFVASSIPADESVSAAPSVPTDTTVHADKSHLDDTQTASEHVSTEPTVDETTPLSSCTRRKHLAKKRVTPIVDIADDALIMFDSASNSDDDPLPYAPYDSMEMVPSLLGSIHAYYDMEGHTKHFTSLRELLHMVEKNDLRRLLGASLDDEDAYDFWRNQDGWRIRNWRLYPRAQVHVLETMDGRVIYMFVDVSYPLSAATLQRMLNQRLEVPKLLVGRDLTMDEQLVSFIKVALLTA